MFATQRPSTPSRSWVLFPHETSNNWPRNHSSLKKCHK